jgi:superfamily II DNA/RNA helicase
MDVIPAHHHRPSAMTTMGFARLGYPDMTEAQRIAIEAWDLHPDILLQSRAGTGKSSMVGIAESQCFERVGVSVFIAPNRLLVDQQMVFLNKFLGHSSILVRRVDGDGGVCEIPCGKRVILTGTATDLLRNVVDVPLSMPVIRIYVDEVDEMMSEGRMQMTLACVKRFVSLTTKSMFMTSTMPPYIAVRVRDFLESLEQCDRELYHIELCRSTTTDASMNAVRPSLTYRYCTLNPTQHLGHLMSKILAIGDRPRCIVFGSTVKQARSIAGYMGLNHPAWKCAIDTDILRTSWNIAFDTKGNFSRGLNFDNLKTVICLGLPEDKETLLHQWGRAARNSGETGAVYMLLLQEEVPQLDYLSFQLGIAFDPFENTSELIPADVAPSHPFHLDTSTSQRMEHIRRLVSAVGGSNS